MNDKNQISTDAQLHNDESIPDAQYSKPNIQKGYSLNEQNNEPIIPELPKEARLPANLGNGACDWLDRYVEFSRKWSPRSFDGFHEATGIWLLSTTAARRVTYNFGKQRYTNLYIMLGGRTTLHAKSSATDIGRQTLEVCGMTGFLAPDESTPQSFIRQLSSNSDGLDNLFDPGKHLSKDDELRLCFKGQIGWYAEEFGSWLSSMTRTDGIMADFRGLLRIFDDCPTEYSRSTISRNREIVKNPYLALIANLTPADLKPLAKKGTQLWGDGFLARFAFITPPHDEVLSGRFPPGERKIPDHISRPLIEWHMRLGIPEIITRTPTKDNPKGKPDVEVVPKDPHLLHISKDVEDAVYNYHDALLKIAKESEIPDLDGNYGRLAEKALRIAALFASLGSEDEIKLNQWARAQEIVERWRTYTHRLYHQVTGSNYSNKAKIEDKIIEILGHHSGGPKYPNGMTATDVGRFIHGLGRIEITEYIRTLVNLGVVSERKTARTCRYLLAAEHES